MAFLLPDTCEFLEIGRQFFFFCSFLVFCFLSLSFFFFYATRIKIPSLSKHFLFLYL